MTARPEFLDAFYLREQKEHEFDALLKSYILDAGKFRFGGIVNLLTTAAKIMAEESKLEDDDWEKASIALDECADAVDLKYLEDE